MIEKIPRQSLSRGIGEIEQERKEKKEKKRETRTHQLPEGDPVLSTSLIGWCKREKPAIEVGADCESQPIESQLARCQTGTLLWPCQVHGRSRR